MKHASAPDFLFETFGSHGDVLPLLGIAGELVKRGYCCQLVANEHFRVAAQAHGVRFFASIDERTNHLSRRRPSEYVYYTLDGVRRYFSREGAFGEHTLVVNTHVFAASEALAEAHALRVLRLVLFPVRIKSKVAPPWPLGARAEGPNGEHFLKVVLPAMHRAANRHPAMLERINSVRMQLGLERVALVDQAQANVVEQAALFPEWFGMPAADWPKMDFLGFPLPKSEGSLPPQVRQFLKTNPKPLVFTTGTSLGTPHEFFRAAKRCCAELDRPGIFLSQYLSNGGRQHGPRIAHFNYVELDQLLPHAELLIHHGGMGTTARALQAGIPQIISPMGFDQPDNGRRIEKLGVGSVVPRAAMSGFAEAAKALWASRDLRAKLAEYRAALAGNTAVQRAADLLTDVRSRTSHGSSQACAWDDTTQTKTNKKENEYDLCSNRRAEPQRAFH